MTIYQLKVKARQLCRQLYDTGLINYSDLNSYREEIDWCANDFRRTQLNELIDFMGKKLPVMEDEITPI